MKIKIRTPLNPFYVLKNRVILKKIIKWKIKKFKNSAYLLF